MSTISAIGMAVKIGIKGVGTVGEAAVKRLGVSKRIAEEAKAGFEIVHETLTDTITVQYSESESGLTKTEQVAVQTLAETIGTLGITLALAAAGLTGGVVVFAVGAGVAVIVGLNEEGINNFYANFKEQLFKGLIALENYDLPAEFSESMGTSGPIPRRDPLILDLNGDGIKTMSVNTEVYFDHNADGFAERTGWVSPQDGLLAIDRNGDGKINDGHELFGDQTILQNGRMAANGFEALADLDSNKDGKIDVNDSAYSQLKVWQDANSDGSSTPDELHTLNELGIAAINLNSTPISQTDSEGNTQIRLGSFEKADGSIMQIGEYQLQRNNAFTIPQELLEVPEDIAALPDLPASGLVHNLQQAMVRDTSGQLKTLIEQFIAEADPNGRNALLDQIFFKWTGSEGIGPNSRGSNIDARKLAVLEKFMGQAFVGQSGTNPNYEASIELKEIYRKLFELCYADLMKQTHLKSHYEKVFYTWNDQTQTIQPNFALVTEQIKQALNNNPEQGKQDLGEFARSLRGFISLDVTDYLCFRETFITQNPDLGWIIDSAGLPVVDKLGQGQWAPWSKHIMGNDISDAIKGSLTEGDGCLNSLLGNDVIYGTQRPEVLINEQGDSVLVAGANNDTIWAGAGNDILDGGAGNDQLYGETGNDTYIFRRDSGQDVIIDSDPTAGNTDTIWLGSNLTPNDITLRRIGNDLTLRINETTDMLKVKDFFRNDSPINKIERIQFSDGTVWGINEIAYRITLPTETNDIIHGGVNNDALQGYGGDDILYGHEGNDILLGGKGVDKLYGDAGDDILDGGSGDDTLDGGAGNDTYILGRGSGRDTINDTDTTTGNIDTILVDSGIQPSEIGLQKIGDDLKLSITGAIDTLTVKNWFLDDAPRYRMENIQFADGTVWNMNDIKNFFIQGTEGGDTIIGYNSADTISGLGGNDTIYGRAGDDTINGSIGDDKLYGETGNDNLQGDEGRDILYGGDGNDALDGSAGNDQLYGEKGSDTLLGGDGSDMLYGEEGNDIFDGGAGNDTLYGGYSKFENKANGNDTYLFGRGSGQDTVIDRDASAGNVDTILMAADILPEDVIVGRNGEDLVLSIAEGSDRLTVWNWFYDEAGEWQVERIQFADGTVWDVAEIKQRLLQGTPDDDTLIGYSTADTLEGLAGNDVLYGRGGDDVLEGGSGNDTLYGGTGNDILEGEEGTDELYGGSGNDTYIFRTGSGQDTILDRDTTIGNIDTIFLPGDIGPADLSLRRNGENLVLSIEGGSDTLTVRNWFYDEAGEWQVERIRFTDGTVWDAAEIKQRALQGTPDDDTLIGYSTADTLEGLEGNDTLYGGAGNDTYLFGRGSGQDTVIEADTTPGNIDTIVFAADVLPGDILLRQAGNDLCITINGTDDRLQISGWFADEANRIERLQFANGTVWDSATIQDLMLMPTDTDDYLSGTPYADVLDGGGGDDEIWGNRGDDRLIGGSGNDFLYGEKDNDQLLGGAGADYLDGGYGSNILDGGPGDDLLDGQNGEGNTYYIERGGGFDHIRVKASEWIEAGDTVVFGEGILPDDISVQFREPGEMFEGEGAGSGNPLLAIGIGADEGLLIEGFEESGESFSNYGWSGEGHGETFGDGGQTGILALAVKRFVFADGTELSLEELLARADEGVIGEQYGTGADDFLKGSVTDDIIFGGESGDNRIDARDGNDQVYGDGGDDAISGGSGADVVDGGDGNDVIAGGQGSDTVFGNSGDDVYAFNRGDGNDTIWGAEGTDTLSFGVAISPEDVQGYVDGEGNLVIAIQGGTDRLAISWGEGLALARLQFIQSDGTGRVYDLQGIVTELSAALLAATSEAPVALCTQATARFELAGEPLAGADYAVAYGQTGDLFAEPAYYGGGPGDDFITARAGDDTIDAGDGNNVIKAGDGNNTIFAGTGNDSITAGKGNDTIYAGDGENRISSGAGADWIAGGPSYDVVEAGPGDDFICAGPGNDLLSGGSGDDTYCFNLGDGTLTINDLANSSGANRIVFGEHITPDDLILKTDENTLVIEVGNNGDAIRLSNFNAHDAYGTHAVEVYEFADGQKRTYAQLIDTKGFDIAGSPTDDFLSGTSANDRITGSGGDDLLMGGPGADILDGGSGHDVYVFNPGDGIDFIRDMATAESPNLIRFGPGITLSDLSLSFDAEALIIKVGNNGDAICLEGFDPDDAKGPYPVETFAFEDGTIVSFSELLGLGFTIEGTPQDDTLTGTSVSDTFLGKAGNDTLSGGAGDDVYRFDQGHGVDTIDDSSAVMEPNTLIFGPGITPADLKLSHDPETRTLIIAIGNSGDSVKLTNFDTSDPFGSHAVEYFQFNDGQILTYSQIIDLGFDIEGTIAEDTLTGTSAADRILGKESNDTLSGGAGNDLLSGGAGDDAYLFNLGDGLDLIADEATVSEGNILVFGEGITPAGLERRLTFRENTLIMRIGENGDEVHLANFNPNEADTGPRAIQTFVFADGTIINYEQLVQNTFIIQGDAQDDLLSGTNITDRLYGYEGFDRLAGNGGNDTLTGGAGDDELVGGAGDDTYVFHLGDGVDTIYDTSIAGQGNLILFGEGITRNDLAVSRAGNMLALHIGAAGDVIRLMNFDPSETGGSLVARTIEFADGSRMQLGELLATDGDDVIITGSGDDVVNGREGNDLISTGDGSDTLIGGDGSDTLIGGGHNDTYVFNAGDGVDTIIDTVRLGEGNRIEFGPGIAPNDITLTIENTALKINVGSNGDGILLGNFDPYDAAAAKVIETFEFENFTEIPFTDFIKKYGIYTTGTEGDDNICGTNIFDTITGLAGNDTINGGTGADVMEGGEGDDSYYVDNAGDKVIESLNEGDDTVIASTGYTLPENVENLVLAGLGAIDGTGNSLNNTITGNFAANTLTGDFGNDILKGSGGNDSVYGGEGNDTLFGGEGIDTLTGGFGNDTYVFNPGDGVDTIYDTATSGEGNLILFGEGISREDLETEVEGNLLTIRVGQNGDAILLPDFDLENINGTHVAKTLQFADGTQALLSSLFDPGTEGDDVINTGPLDDVINAKGGNDIVRTDGGNDTITGGSGNDMIYAGSGNDMLTGNEGNDILDGGEGNDRYIYNDGDGLDRIDESGGADTISLGPGLDFDHTIIRKEGSVARMRLLDEEGNETDKGIDIALNSDGTISVETVSFSGGNSFNTKDLVIGSQTTYGTRKSDFIRTGRNDDTIYAFRGGDTVYAGLSNDIVYGNNGRDKLYGEQGNDRLYGNNGDDILDGGSGNDTLDGGNGDDLLKGGSGNDAISGGNGEDTLYGGAGDDILCTGKGEDTVMFNPGDGHDTLVLDPKDGHHHCWPWNNDGDVVKFGVNPINLVFSRTGDELDISINGSSDRLTVEKWSSSYQVDKFIANDGRHLHDREVDCLIQAMTAFGAESGMTWSQAIQDKPQEVQQILARYWET